MTSPTTSDLEASYILVRDDPSPNPPHSLSGSPAAREPHPSQSNAYKAGSAPTYAHDWSNTTTGGISVQGRHFVDSYGRVCGLRGVNLSGSCKTPVNHDNSTFPSNHESVTFVGRPFPLEEAHEHFSRLRRWGLTFVRFLVTWEAIEHEGPGIYDMEYLSYLQSLLSLLPKYGIVAFVAMHQDVWSRYSGGSGAPAWTLTAVGFDIHKLEDVGAAWLKGIKGGGYIDEERGLWSSGYQKLAAATMATAFWAGDTFLPKLKAANGVSIEQYLQSAFFNAWEALARAVGHLDGVIGFEVMNEPHRGYIELQSMHEFDYNTDFHLAHVPSAIQSFALGAGHTTAVRYWTRSFPMPTRHTSYAVLNPDAVNAWRPDGPTSGQCAWEMHGVWGWDRQKQEAVVLREHYFLKHPMTDRDIDWYTDFYYPFLLNWASRIKNVVGKDKIIFTEAIPNEFCPSSWTVERRPPNMVYSPHWYDLNALFQKSFGNFTVNVQGLSRGMFIPKAFYWGQRGARENYALQIRNLAEAGYKSLGEVPVIIGECGVPMDMNLGEAFSSDDWTMQARMMDAMITGLERSLVGYTLWNYNSNNDDVGGDHWNGENFSWFSRRRALPPAMLLHDQASAGLDQGGRILRALVRPYPAKTAGVPLLFDYEINSGRFVFAWAEPVASAGASSLGVSRPRAVRESEIFVPALLAHDRRVVVEGLGGGSYVYDETRQTLFVLPEESAPGKSHRIVVSLDPPLDAMFEINDFWGDFGSRIMTMVAILVAICAYLLVGR